VGIIGKTLSSFSTQTSRKYGLSEAIISATAASKFLDAKRVDKRKNLDAAVAEMIASDKPYFLEVCVEKEDNVFPMIPTGASVSDIRLK
jgi:acetolactate synthase-1/2/3 large subunit